MDAVDEVKQRLSVEDVVGQYVQLKRAGRNFKGLSPFSNEKTPSFVVSPDKQIWHDFSSGRGGDMFSFVMEVEGLDFRAALEHLARQAGVDLEQFKPTGGPSGPDKKRLLAACDAAARFYQLQFSKNQTALEYVFKKRQLDKETVLAWRLGYSPNTGTALVSYLRGKGFTEAEIKLAGLTSQRRSGLGDMFRGRLMIPLCDATGQVIGFTARLLADDPQAPKYINTPQTPLYDKSRHVFGLHHAKEAIRKSGYSVIAEGNLDVISSYQAGVRQVVATAGTALTEYQLKALSRLAGDVRLAFDADRAGLAATERAIPIASKVKISLSVITIPAGKDPDELIKKDPALWTQAIEGHDYALDWLMARYAAQLDLTSAQGKRQYSDILLPVIQALDDAVERDHYLNAIADKIGINRGALDQKMAAGKQDAAPKRLKKVVAAPLEQAPSELVKLQDRLLAITVQVPELREYLAPLEQDMLPSKDAQKIMNYLLTHPDSKMTPKTDYGKILSLLYEELYSGLEQSELQYEAARVQARLIEQYVKHQKSKIAQELDVADSLHAEKLLARAGELDELLRLITKENARAQGS